MDIKDKLLEKIENEHVTPIAQWRFLARGYGLWALSGVLLIFGSLGVASILYILTKNDWDIYSEIHESKLTHIITTLPYLWLALFALMLVLLYVDLKHTKHGYKYNALSLVLGTFAASVLIGGGLHAAGFGEGLDELIREKTPRQAHMFNPRLKGLTDPEHGVIMGRIIQIDTISSTTTHILIKNPLLEDTWIVIATEHTTLPEQGIHLLDHIRALGESAQGGPALGGEEGEEYDENDDVKFFLADIILPFNKIHKEFRKQGGPPPGFRPHKPKPAKSLPN